MTLFNILCLASRKASRYSLLICNHCNKICKSKSGLTNHIRSCINKIKNNNLEIKTCYCCNTVYLYNRPNYCNICKEILDHFDLNSKNLK